ncbi:MAG TPA: efflux RND transporter periplasmic adaptor subunit [Polyangiales bacterium]|nr:efflux RND transporter periplasmic adaptor subunit [Polyangiales bacterium]
MSQSAIGVRLLVTGALWAAAGCGPGKRDEHAHDEHEEHAQQAHAGEVALSAEAAALAGIRVGPVERRALGGGVAIPGEVQFDPTSTAHVGPLAQGRITRIEVALGDRVRRNQLLAVVASGDASSARARLEQARSRLAAAEAGLKRQQQLSAEGIGAQRTLVEAEAKVGELRAETSGLRQQLSVFGSGGAGELQLVSPIEGIVVDVLATLGETASPDQVAFVITDPTRVSVRGSVPELEIDRIELGMAVVVRLHAFPDSALPGVIAYVAPALDERTRSLPIRVTLKSADARLRSGLYGAIELVGGQLDERVLVVPTDAVATLDGRSTVFVPADEPNTFRAVPVRLGRRAGGFYELLGGVQEAAPVVLSGSFTLKSALKSGELAEGHAH